MKTPVEMNVILVRAIANEESAAAFYRQAAGRMSDPVTRDALEGLMRDEVEHKRLLEEFRDGDRPLPCSLVITYKKARGHPQFWAQFNEWDLSPSARDKQFEFEPLHVADQQRSAVGKPREVGVLEFAANADLIADAV